MIALIMAAVTVSMLRFDLDSGTPVVIDYSSADDSPDNAAAKGVRIARWVWKDFCGSAGSAKCISGNSYQISISLLRDSCVVFMNKQIQYPNGVTPVPKYNTVGYYGCTTDFEVFREGNDTFIPAQTRP
jgi:hypothetical protein